MILILLEIDLKELLNIFDKNDNITNEKNKIHSYIIDYLSC